MADQTISLELQIDAVDSAKTIADFKNAIVDLKTILTSVGESFNGFAEGASKLNSAQDKVDKLNNLVGDTTSVSKKAEAFVTLGNKIASGFEAAKGAADLFGASGEELQKVLTKVQDATQIAQGVKDISSAGDAFKSVKTIALDAFTGIKDAIVSTGIGLLLIAVGAIYENWDKIKGAIGGVNTAQQKLTDDANNHLKAEQDKLQSLSSQDNILKLQGKSEEDILKIKEKQTDETIQAAGVVIQNAKTNEDLQVKASERNKKLLQEYLDLAFKPLNELYKLASTAINKILDLLNKIPGVDIKFRLDTNLVKEGTDAISNAVFNPEKTKQDGDKVIEDAEKTYTDLLNKRAGYQLQIKKMDEDAKKGNTNTDGAASSPPTSNTRDNEDIAPLNAKPAGVTVPEDNTTVKLYDNKFKLQTDFSKKSLAAFRQYQADRKASGEAANNEELANDKKIADAKFAVAESGLNAVSGLVNAFAGKSIQGQKEAFEINKQISVARALISTYQGANEALNTPLNSVAPGIGIANAAIIVAAGLANVAQIESQQFNGGGSGSSSSAVSTSAPSLQPLIQPTTTLSNQNQDTQNGRQQPLKVFVTESDIRTATNRIDTITSRAVIH